MKKVLKIKELLKIESIKNSSDFKSCNDRDYRTMTLNNLLSSVKNKDLQVNCEIENTGSINGGVLVEVLIKLILNDLGGAVSLDNYNKELNAYQKENAKSVDMVLNNDLSNYGLTSGKYEIKLSTRFALCNVLNIKQCKENNEKILLITHNGIMLINSVDDAVITKTGRLSCKQPKAKKLKKLSKYCGWFSSQLENL